MPVTPTYPGVYIEEVPSGVRTIRGVATSIAAFLDFFPKGPMNKAVQILNMGDFERELGGLDSRSEAGYAIQQFFANGGTEAWVVRLASEDPNDSSNTPTRAQVFIAEQTAVAPAPNLVAAEAAATLTVSAVDEGIWGSRLRVAIDPDVPKPDEFNLIVTEYQSVGGRVVPVRQEVFRNLSMDGTKANFAGKKVNDPNQGSKLVRSTAKSTLPPDPPPLSNGTFSDGHPGDPPSITLSASPEVNVTVTDWVTPITPPAPLPLDLPAGPHPLTAVAPALEAAIRAGIPDNPVFSGATVDVIGNRLRILAGPGSPRNRVTFTPTTASDEMAFTNNPDATVNSTEYTLEGTGLADTAQIFAVEGRDGVTPNAADLIGNLSSKTGIYALEDVDLFNLLCVPRTAVVDGSPDALTPVQASAVITVAETYCEERRAFFLMDTPVGVDTPQEIKNWLAGNPTLRHRNAALFYPRVRVPDPLDDFRLRAFGPSGTIAGLCARTDASRGVWKSPGGTEASLRNVSELDYVLTDAENGVLNPLAINCLRTFPVYGHISWGARTLAGADQQASEWKYIPVRRLALFLEESLYRGTKWVVFEPNDEPLWAQIRLNVGAFMNNLFRQGAFQGQTPQEAYLVKCDGETTTQNDINLGIVNIVVGFAPLKPAEFVIIKIQQLAGQIQT